MAVKVVIEKAVQDTIESLLPSVEKKVVEEKKSPLQEFVSKGRAGRILLFVMTDCKPCEAFKKNYFPPLKDKGWLIGPESTNHIQIINIDLDVQLAELMEIKSVPMLRVIKDHKLEDKITRGADIHSTFDIGNLLKDQEEVKRETSFLTTEELRAFAQEYRGPNAYTTTGSYKAHLQDSNHRFTKEQVNELTEQECYKIHGASHYRLS